MRRLAVLIASAAMNVSTIPVLASECAVDRDIDAYRTRWAAVRSKYANAGDKEKICRTYAVLFHEFVMLRQTAASCAQGGRNLALLDSEIDAFNDLLATKCND